MDQAKTKKLCFWCFCRFLCSALMLRRWKTFVYVIGALFYIFLLFCIVLYWSIVLRVSQARSMLILFYAIFWVNKANFLPCKYTSFSLSSKTVQWNYQHFFFLYRCQTKERVLRVNISKITCSNIFNGDHF